MLNNNDEINTFQNFVYIIQGININSSRIKYYIGYTDNLYERIRKHNREITGGAKATRGYKWSYCCVFTNIRSSKEGLQLEKRLQICKKRGNIIDKINTFFLYIDKNNRVSPNGIILDSKIFLYIDKSLLPKYGNDLINHNKIKNLIMFNIKFMDIILDHLMSSVSFSKLSKKNKLRQLQYINDINTINDINSIN